MERVEAKLQPLLRPGSGAGTELSDAEITDQISEVLLLKNLDADGEPLVILYMMVNGCWYEQTENEKKTAPCRRRNSGRRRGICCKEGKTDGIP